MQTIVDDLFSANQQKQGAAFAKTIGLIRENKWDREIGYGCNLFHFVAFVPECDLASVLPDWKERLQRGIDELEKASFDKENNACLKPKIKGLIKDEEGISALNRDTPLGIAIYRGNKTAARIFLKNGADIYHRNATGDSILHLAASSNTLVDEISQQLIVRTFEMTTDRGETAALQAERHGHLETAKKLVERYTELQVMVACWVNKGSGVAEYREELAPHRYGLIFEVMK